MNVGRIGPSSPTSSAEMCRCDGVMAGGVCERRDRPGGVAADGRGGSEADGDQERAADEADQSLRLGRHRRKGGALARSGRPLGREGLASQHSTCRFIYLPPIASVRNVTADIKSSRLRWPLKVDKVLAASSSPLACNTAALALCAHRTCYRCRQRRERQARTFGPFFTSQPSANTAFVMASSPQLPWRGFEIRSDAQRQDCAWWASHYQTLPSSSFASSCSSQPSSL